MLKIWKFYSWYCEKFVYVFNDYFIEKCKIYYFFVQKIKIFVFLLIDEDGRLKDILIKVKKEKVYKYDSVKKIKVKKYKKEVRVKYEFENLNLDKLLFVKVENGRIEILEKSVSFIKFYLFGGNIFFRKIFFGDFFSNKFLQVISILDVK